MNSIIDHLVHPVAFLAAVLVTAWAVFFYLGLSEHDRKAADFGAVLISGVGIVYTVLLTIQAKRSGSALRFAERWNAVDFTDSRKEIGEVMRGTKTLNSVDRVHIIHMLNFFEEMSISVRQGEAQEHMLRTFFIGVLVDGADVFRPWIAEQQKRNPTVFEQYVWLANRWVPARKRELAKLAVKAANKEHGGIAPPAS